MSAVPGVRRAMDGVKKIPTSLNGVFVLEPRVFGDERGFFFESYNQRVMAELGISERFVQDNHSCSGRDVLRGLHYQVNHAQGKLVRVVEGEILDVAVDLRRSSASFGRWEAVRLSGENKRMLWIPAGLAHGFRVVSEKAHVLYKATDFYSPEDERTLAWNDPDLKIDWELGGEPIVSAKDQRGVAFRDAETFA
ncbi:MAG: dTDP-4-dehydrorhamnose 3,5-epimerase [Candidatus Sulfotelmatobacter sp.]